MSTSTRFADLKADLLSVQPSVIHRILLLIPSQESEQNEIELKEDNPQALEGVLRHIYGCKIDDHHQKTWQYWLDLSETADKYLEPRLSERATLHFRIKALTLQDSDVETICEILQALQDIGRYELLKSFAVDLTMRNLHLLRDERFRAQVYSCKRIMLKLIDRLSFAADLVPKKMDCPHHGPQECYRKRS